MKRPYRKTRNRRPKLTVKFVRLRRALKQCLVECMLDKLLLGSAFIRRYHGIPYRVDPVKVTIFTDKKTGTKRFDAGNVLGEIAQLA